MKVEVSGVVGWGSETGRGGFAGENRGFSGDCRRGAVKR
jgi:hypothetical protein